MTEKVSAEQAMAALEMIAESEDRKEEPRRWARQDLLRDFISQAEAQSPPPDGEFCGIPIRAAVELVAAVAVAVHNGLVVMTHDQVIAHASAVLAAMYPRPGAGEKKGAP